MKSSILGVDSGELVPQIKLKVNKMSLLKNKPDFETEDAGTATANAATTAEATTKTEAKVETKADPKVEAKAATSTAVAEKTSGALAAAKFDMRVMETFKDALPVEYNTLAQVVAQQGSLIDRETKTVLGDKVVFELLSYQDSFVVSPEDDDASDELVKYSNDGVICSEGTNVQDHLNFLKENGFPKARLKQRVVLVGAVESAAKSDKFNGSLVQLDLSPASRTQWIRFTANIAYGLKIGKFKPEQVSRISAETTLAQGKGNDTFTLVQFNVVQ